MALVPPVRECSMCAHGTKKKKSLTDAADPPLRARKHAPLLAAAAGGSSGRVRPALNEKSAFSSDPRKGRAVSDSGCLGFPPAWSPDPTGCSPRPPDARSFAPSVCAPLSRQPRPAPPRSESEGDHAGQSCRRHPGVAWSHVAFAVVWRGRGGTVCARPRASVPRLPEGRRGPRTGGGTVWRWWAPGSHTSSPRSRGSCPPRTAPPARPRYRRSRGADMPLRVHACVSLVLVPSMEGRLVLLHAAAFPRLGIIGDLPLHGARVFRVWRD